MQLIYAKSPNATNPAPPEEDARYWIENTGKFLSDMSGGNTRFEWRYENKYFEMESPSNPLGLREHRAEILGV